MDLGKKRRSMNLDEQKTLKKSTWIIVAIIPVFLLFLWVAYTFPNLPSVMRIAVFVIPTMAVFIFTLHHFKKLKDLSTNEVEEYRGLVTQKVEFRQYNRTGSRLNKSETRYILLSGKKFILTRKQMSLCEEGKEAVVVVAPESQVVLSVTSLPKYNNF